MGKIFINAPNRASWSALAAALLWASTAEMSLWSAPAPQSTNSPASTRTNAAPIPLAEVAAQIEASSATLQSISATLSSDPSVSALEDELPVLTREINARLEENSRIISRNPSVENLRRLEREWHNLLDQLSDWSRLLTKQVTQIESELERLADLRQRWERTQASVDNDKLPPEVLERVQGVLAQVAQTQDKLEGQRSNVLVLQSRVTEQHTRVSQALDSIERARTEMLQRLFLRDSAAIWSPTLWSSGPAELVREGHRSISRQVTALLVYGQRAASRFLLHGFVFLVLAGALFWARRWVGVEKGEHGLQHAALLVQAPVSSAIVLALLLSGWMYPQAPRLLWPILGACGLVPASVLLRRLLDPHLIPVLSALIGFYFLDQLRTVAASQALLSRWLFLTETLAGTIFSAWLILSKRLCEVPEARRSTLWKTIRIGARLALISFSLALVLNILGYQSLSKLICNGLLASAYLALLFYALARIVDSLALGLLRIPPLGRLELVRQHRAMLHARTRRVVGALALVLWAVSALDAVALRGLAFRTLGEIWSAKAALGSFSFTVGDLFLFGLTIWAAFFVSGVVRFVLQEEVYPRVQLAPGLYYSISQVLHYVVLLTGFFIGIALLGVNLTKLTILAGAFGVGIGFGLQNIVNNFVSGIILLFERPVKVGDLIQLENTEGLVKRIGIRASVVRTINGSEIVVPNGKLISDPLTNWTFSNRQRLITLPIAVAADTPPQHVIDLLKTVAVENPQIMKEPPPLALFTGFGGGSLTFELRAWTSQFEDWSRVRSDLALAINAALSAQKITIR